jgi:hypothetical protein
VVGAVTGGLLGNAVSHGGGKTGGTIIGAGVGAVAGNQIAKGRGDCSRAYGYYDTNGMWHANAVDRTAAAGYYDRNGAWVEGSPNGYYDARGVWVASNTTANGYYDSNGYWVPASANGYYDVNGRWVGGVASGYYSDGRWVSGPAVGHYDSMGRWISGQANGHLDANGVWVADAQPGYYDVNGRWHAGPVMGYYDAQGRWFATAAAADRMGANVNYDSRNVWVGAPPNARARVSWLGGRIERARDEGRISPFEARRAMRTLDQIRREEAMMRHYNGRLAPRDEVRVQARLDDLSANLRWMQRN